MRAGRRRVPRGSRCDGLYPARSVLHGLLHSYVPCILCCTAIWGRSVRNITVTVDDETHRAVRVRAAELDTSVSALVRDYLRSLARGRDPVDGADTEVEHRRRLLAEVAADFDARGIGIRMAENLPRDELYDRHALR